MRHHNVICRLVFLLMCALAAPGLPRVARGDASAFLISLETGQHRIDFTTTDARPESWQACYPSRAKAGVGFCAAGEPSAVGLIVKNQPELSGRIERLNYECEHEVNDDFFVLRFTSEPLEQGVFFEKIYEIARSRYEVKFTLRVRGEQADQFVATNSLALVLRHGKEFVPAPSAGFAGSYEKVRRIYTTDGEVLEFAGKIEVSGASLGTNEWAGFRNRFWALLLRPDEGRVLVTFGGKVGAGELVVAPESRGKELRFHLYAGPIAYDVLKNEAPELTGLLFAGYWFWMRWLCLGLLFLLDWLVRVAGNHGIAIILLALCVKIIMLPLTLIAEKWQREVNRKKSILQPFLDEIKANYRGEEQSRRVLALHKEQGIHPLFVLKSLFGVMIQVPVLLAAYYMLSENIVMSGAGFLWVDDLACPDHIARLPFNIPFFGADLNLLPFLMMGVTLLSSWRFDDGSLSPGLMRKQRRSLYWMALLFFVLLYTFPAGMVLFWTVNNLLSFIKDQLANVLRCKSASA